MRDRVFCLFVSLGIEVRNFVFSGLMDELKQLGDCVLFSCKESLLLDDLCYKNGIKKVQIDTYDEIRTTRAHWESRFLSVRRARLRLNGIKTFQLWSESSNLRLKDFVIGNRMVYSLLEFMNDKNVLLYYYSDDLAKKYREEGVTDLFLQGYASCENMTAAITAEKLGIRIWVVNWGWKDFYINEYLHFKVAGFFTWSDHLKNMYCKFNSKLNHSNTWSVGNLSYEKYIDYKCVNEKKFYADKYKFNINDKIFVYTLLHPSIYSHEENIIGMLLENNSLRKDVIILIKPNPMDSDWKRFYQLEEKYPACRVMENLWIYDKDTNFNMMTEEARVEWEDILYHCSGTINVPSTVTIESLLFNKPVINPLYNEANKIESEFLRLYESSFYKLVSDRKDVVKTLNTNETASVINEVLNRNLTVNTDLSYICKTKDVLNTVLKIVKDI